MSDKKGTVADGREVEDVLRRLELHRGMLAELVEAHLLALNDLKDLQARPGAPAGAESSAPDIEAEIRRTARAGRLLAGPAEGSQRAAPRVLLIDDDPTTRNIISHFLRKEGWAVEKAADGSDGLVRARNAPPDLIIIDAVLTGRDGFEILSLLRQDPLTAGLPILMLSTLGEESAIVKGLEEGADYIIKPFSPQILVATVRKILGDRCGRVLDHRSV